MALWHHMDGRFKQVDERFRQVDQRFDRLEAKLSGRGERIARVEGVQSVVIASAPGPPPAANPTGPIPSKA